MLQQSKDHLSEMKESYGAHLFFATRMGIRMLGAAGAIFIHALIPALFPWTGSRMIRTLHEEIETRKASRSHDGPC